MPQIIDHQMTKNQMHTPTKKEQKNTEQKQRARDQHALAERRDRRNARRERERERCGKRAVTGFENQAVGNGLFFQRYFKSIGSCYTL